MRIRDLVGTVERLEGLDAAAEWVSSRLVRRLGNSTLKDLLSGVWLGHPLHPVLTDLTLGAWGSALVLDLVGGEDAAPAATTLVGLGTISALPTAATGLSDWSDTVGGERRVGLAHALANASALGAYTGSLVMRLRGRRGAGIALGAVGAGLAAAAGHLGGHLTLSRGVGVDHTLFDEAPTEWTPVAAEEQLVEGAATLVKAGDYGVLLHRRGAVLHAIADRCSHAGGPLHEGAVDGELCVTCPWHGSRFRLTDGSIARGPATAPQPALDVRVRSGRIEVRARPRA